MVRPVMNFSRNGLTDWFIQRVSALVVTIFTIFMVCYLLFNPQIDFNTWHSLFHSPVMSVFTVITLLAFLAHAWIGMWTVLTDYIKPFALSLLLQTGLILLLLSYLVWVVMVLWF